MSKGKMILYIAITALFFAGVVCEFFNFGLGLALWSVSLIAGLLVFLYQRMTDSRKAKEDAMDAAENAGEKADAETEAAQENN